MAGQLLNIIFGFYYSLFSPYPPLDFSNYNGAFFTALGMEGNFFSNFASVLGPQVSNSANVLMIVFVSYIATYITIIILTILLFKLFKWLFTLIFKLFRLN